MIKVEDIVSSALSGNYSAFESVPGIGKKTAQRIVLELKGKVDDMGIISDTYESSDNPNIIEDVFGKYQLKFSGKIKNHQYQNYKKKLFFLIYYQCFSKNILKKYSQEKF